MNHPTTVLDQDKDTHRRAFKAILLGMVLATLAACSAEPAEPKYPHREELSPTVSRVCSGTRAIYETMGQWSTTHTIVENDPECGGTGK